MKPLKMAVDTGASLTLVSEQTFHSHWPDTRLAEFRIKLSSYGGESIPVLGTIDVLVKYGNQARDHTTPASRQRGRSKPTGQKLAHMGVSPSLCWVL